MQSIFLLSLSIIALALPQQHLSSGNGTDLRFCTTLTSSLSKNSPVQQPVLMKRDMETNLCAESDPNCTVAQMPAVPVSLKAFQEPEYFWDVGSTVTISFDKKNKCGDRVIKKIKPYIEQWNSYVNLTLKVVKDGDRRADILIQCLLNTGSYSQIGKDSKNFRPSMNFGWLSDNDNLPDILYASIVLHEFGHALGFLHEHQSPALDTKVNCKSPQVLQFAKQQGWPGEIACSQLQAEILPGTTYSSFDPNSIMEYKLPGSMLGLDFNLHENYNLSIMDIAYAEQTYPFYSGFAEIQLDSTGDSKILNYCADGYYPVRIKDIAACSINLKDDRYKRLGFVKNEEIMVIYVSDRIDSSGKAYKSLKSVNLSKSAGGIINDFSQFELKSNKELKSKSNKYVRSSKSVKSENDLSEIFVTIGGEVKLTLTNGKLLLTEDNQVFYCVVVAGPDGGDFEIQLDNNSTCIDSFTLI